MMARLIENVAQLFLLLALAPLVTGVIRTLKARMQTRRGPGILQPYRDLGKLLRKGSAVSDQASWVFRLPCTAFRRFRVRPVAAAGPCLRRIRRPPR